MTPEECEQLICSTNEWNDGYDNLKIKFRMYYREYKAFMRILKKIVEIIQNGNENASNFYNLGKRITRISGMGAKMYIEELQESKFDLFIFYINCDIFKSIDQLKDFTMSPYSSWGFGSVEEFYVFLKGLLNYDLESCNDYIGLVKESYENKFIDDTMKKTVSILGQPYRRKWNKSARN